MICRTSECLILTVAKFIYKDNPERKGWAYAYWQEVGYVHSGSSRCGSCVDGDDCIVTFYSKINIKTVEGLVCAETLDQH
jgi:hypothetical protein